MSGSLLVRQPGWAGQAATTPRTAHQLVDSRLPGVPKVHTFLERVCSQAKNHRRTAWQNVGAAAGTVGIRHCLPALCSRGWNAVLHQLVASVAPLAATQGLLTRLRIHGRFPLPPRCPGGAHSEAERAHAHRGKMTAAPPWWRPQSQTRAHQRRAPVQMLR